MSPSRLAIYRPVTTIVLLAGILVIGGIAVTRMKLAYFPDIEIPGIFIQIPYPNSSPSQIEKSIVKPIEEAVSTISGVKKIESEATPDEARIQLEFDWGIKLDLVRTEVAEKIELIRKDLPRDVENIFILQFNAQDIPVVQARISAPGIDLASNYDLLEKRIKIPIQRIPGVARVELNGVQPRVIYIDLILNKILEHKVDVGALIEKLEKSNASISIGKVRNQSQVISVRSLGNFEDLTALGDMMVNGQGLRLRDIAEINYSEPPISFGRHLNHSYAVAVEVFKEPSANVVEVATKVTNLIKKDFARDPYLKGIHMFVWQDQAAEIRGGLKGITSAGLWGGFFALLILYLFLRRLDMTLIVSFAIPISILCGCAVLYFLGHTFNIMSMMGLMLAVGMLVDNAIVVLESIYKYRMEGLPRLQASENGTRSVELPVIASTATSIIVFLPLIVGKKTEITTFLSEIGIAITATLLCSFLVSVTLIPLATAHFLKDRKIREPRWIQWLKNRYRPVLLWTFRHRIATFFIVVLTLASMALPKHLGLQTGQFTGGKNKRMFLEYDFTDFVYKRDVEKIVTEVEKYLDTQQKDYPFESIYSYFGDSQATTVITFQKEDLTDEEAKEFRQRIRKGLPKFGGVKLYFEDDQERGGSTKYFSVYLYGEDTATLRDMAREAEKRLMKIKGLEDLRIDDKTGRQEVQIVVNREKAIKAGLTPEDISRITLFALGAQRLGRYSTEEKEIEMVVGLRPEDSQNIEDLKKIPVGSGNVLYPLRSLVEFRTVEGQNIIERQNRKNHVRLKATYEGKNFEESRKEIEKIMNEMNWPVGYSWNFDDRVLARDEEGKQMMINYMLALALVYIVMASLFESLIHPLAIIIAIPFALAGVLWFLWITGSPFNIMAQIGMMILMGVVVNNGIVLIDRVHQLRLQGMSRHEALLQACQDRLRPILMTAGTTILGLVPMAIGKSAVFGAYYYPLARAVIGGLTASTFLTLVILPFVYTLWDDFASWLRRTWALSTSSPSLPIPES